NLSGPSNTSQTSLRNSKSSFSSSINNAGQGWDGTDFYDNQVYLFIHATQLQKYGILKGCFRTGVPGELLKFIVEHVSEELILGVDGTYTSQYDVRLFEDSYEAGSEAENAKTLAKNWKLYDVNYYPVIAKLVKEFSVPTDVKADRLYDILKPISESINSDNWNCYWEKIDVDQRVSLIKKLASQNDPFDKTEEMILLMIKTITKAEDQETLLKELEKEDFEFLKEVWDVLDGPERLNLSFVLTRWLLNNRPPAQNFAENAKAAHIQYMNENSGLINNYFTVKSKVFNLYKTNWLEDGLLINFEAGFDSDNNIEIDYEISELLDRLPRLVSYTASPFEWVVLDIKEDFPEYNLEKNSLLPVPAIFVYGIDSDRDRNQNLAALRVAGDVLAILLAPYTAGGSTAILYIEIGAAAIDIAITINREEIIQEFGQDGVIFWDILYGGYNIFTLGRGFFIPTTKTVNGLVRVPSFKVAIEKADEVANAIAKHGNQAEKLGYLQRVDELLNFLKSQKLANYANSIELYHKVLELKLKVERSLNLADIVVDITVKNGNLVVNNAISLGKIDFISNLPTLTQNIRWLPSTVTSVRMVDQFKNVATVSNGTTSVKTLNVVEDLNNLGQFYLTASKLADNLTAPLSSVHQTLLAGGIRHMDNGSVIRYLTNAGNEFAKIENGELILTTADSKWPNPSQYLNQSFITSHLQSFSDGATYLVPKSSLQYFGLKNVGRPDGQFVMTKSAADDLISRTSGDLARIENELGIPSGTWTGDLVRIDVPNTGLPYLALRMPTGNEAGANSLWLPGGKTPEGIKEAVLNQIKSGDYGINVIGGANVFDDLAKTYPHFTEFNLLSSVNQNAIKSVVDAFEPSLKSSLNVALREFEGLAEALTQEISISGSQVKLINFFESLNENIWSRYGMLREHYRTGAASNNLPQPLVNYVESLTNRTGSTTIAARLSSSSNTAIATLGDLLEEDIIPLITEGFRSGDFSGLPQNLINDLTGLRNQGYQVIMTQVKVSSSSFSGAPELDALLVRVGSNNVADLTDCVYLDIKLNANTAFKGAQLNAARDGVDQLSIIQSFVNHQNTPPSLVFPDGVIIPGVTDLNDLIQQNIILRRT
ncbi:MAG: hypothetical protein AAFQ94_30640, partial [Bacteroidota bacterium]